MSSEHDIREDIAAELMTVSELLAAEGKDTDSRKAWTDAARTVTGEVSIDRATRLLCDYENLIGA
ncbi:hypothetical protein PBI_MISSWHITE_92 [Mycobacterium phage MissWhite]|nr:hypothetical protein SEA_JABITH_99 [Mycobacterium phage Jabith]ASR86737.1 hypothetical protein SEA_ET2BRUTUS_99 [Mycobacterium phage Et2Brutus]ASZ75258.1 hypothetical protein PBI_MISSWHITE_92 [Mycobacterium phage MissWhite]QBI99122.1 hypothetical protein SEA_SALZ_95 [Mycobacterium phage Salz]QFG05074.1 hypothetical protein SEA_HUTC2_96 [Mycobacterium phage Hutc2]